MHSHLNLFLFGVMFFWGRGAQQGGIPSTRTQFMNTLPSGMLWPPHIYTLQPHVGPLIIFPSSLNPFSSSHLKLHIFWFSVVSWLVKVFSGSQITAISHLKWQAPFPFLSPPPPHVGPLIYFNILLMLDIITVFYTHMISGLSFCPCPSS